MGQENPFQTEPLRQTPTLLTVTRPLQPSRTVLAGVLPFRHLLQGSGPRRSTCSGLQGVPGTGGRRRSSGATRAENRGNLVGRKRRQKQVETSHPPRPLILQQKIRKGTGRLPTDRTLSVDPQQPENTGKTLVSLRGRGIPENGLPLAGTAGGQ